MKIVLLLSILLTSSLSLAQNMFYAQSVSCANGEAVDNNSVESQLTEQGQFYFIESAQSMKLVRVQENANGDVEEKQYNLVQHGYGLNDGGHITYLAFSTTEREQFYVELSANGEAISIYSRDTQNVCGSSLVVTSFLKTETKI